jgi:hypothetical protein
MVSIILKQYSFDAAATVVILGTIAIICLYIIKILVMGIFNELSMKSKSSTMAA